MPAFLTDRQWLTVLLAAFMAVALSACGGGGGGTTQMPEPPPPPPTAEEMCTDAGNHWVDGACLTPAENTVRMTLASIAMAATAADAQAAYDAVKDQVTAAQGEQLQDAVDARIMAINMAARVDEQKMALSDAAGMIDTSDLSTQALVDAANEAIRSLRQALEDAVDVSDADKAMYQMQLNNAVTAVDTAQGGIDTATRRTNQMTALSGASTTLQAALAALSGATPTQALLDDANNALTALNNAITGGADLTDDEKAPYQREANNAAAPISTAQMAFDNAEDEAEKAANAAMAATAAKLYKGISAQMGAIAADGTNLAANDRDAAYNTAGTALNLSIGGETAPTALAATLTEDKKATVADNHGWEGKRYTHSVTSGDNKGDMYEAFVYSDVGPATMGAKFSAQYPDTATYVTDGVVTVDTTGTDTPPARVAIDSFTQSAGTKTFPLPDPNSNDQGAITEDGSFHGVRGEYKCVPSSTTDTCSASLATKGLTLAGGTWTFTPESAEARVTETADSDYSSYGWWLYTKADGSLTASAFVDDKGTVTTTAATIAGLVAGSATYSGGAAGKYALSSSTGGTNDAGHFTARATLEADFEEDEVTGRIDQFMGADGQSRDWTVELKKSALFDDGTLIGDPTRTGITRGSAPVAEDVAQETVWTIGGTAAAAGGNWSGALKDTVDTKTDTTGVPKVATGTFYTEYGTAGRMVGAFGAKRQ